MRPPDTRLRIDRLTVEAERFDDKMFRRLLAEGTRSGTPVEGGSAEARAADAVLRSMRDRMP